jgi:lipopolysaccharide transport system ATP-binding protein
MVSPTSFEHTDLARKPVVVAQGLSRKYTLYARPSDRLKEVVLRRSIHEDFWALRDVSFEIARGETLGIIGRNGSGKSTLLQLLAGVIQPTTGRVEVHGRVSALLELGAGFNPDFTGVENVILSGAILGVSESEMRRRLDAIAAFAEIGDFLYKPVKTYSSGMYVRLAFATAINIDPDVLIVDEALAVGDAFFQHRCMLRMSELQSSGVTIVVVSHDSAAIKRLCERAIWLEHGRIQDEGNPEHVVARYLASAFGQPEHQQTALPNPQTRIEQTLSMPHIDRRFGDGAAEIVGIGITDLAGTELTSQLHGQTFVIRVHVRFHRAVARPMVGFIMRDRLGTDLTSSNTTLEDFVLPSARADESFIVNFTCRPPYLHPGHYAICPTVAGGDLDEYVIHDWIDNAITLELTGEIPIHTLMRFPVKCSIGVLTQQPNAVR